MKSYNQRTTANMYLIQLYTSFLFWRRQNIKAGTKRAFSCELVTFNHFHEKSRILPLYLTMTGPKLLYICKLERHLCTMTLLCQLLIQSQLLSKIALQRERTLSINLTAYFELKISVISIRICRNNCLTVHT